MNKKFDKRGLLTGIWRIHNNKKRLKPAPIANFYVIGKAEVFKILLISSLVLCFYPIGKEVFADSFYPSGDSMQCSFGQAVSISIGELGENVVGAGEISYNNDLVIGERGIYPETHTMRDVAEVLYPNARRYMGVADRVVVPPGSRVDVGFFPYNYAGHQVTVSEGRLYVGRSDGSGNWGKLGAVASEVTTSFRIWDYMLSRTGPAVEIPYVGSWGVSNYYDPPKGKTIYSFYIGNPLTIVSQNVGHHFDSSGNLIADFSMTLKNDSSYVLQNVGYTHRNFNMTKTFNSGESYTYNYSENLGKNYQLPRNFSFATISVPNMNTECAVYGTNEGISLDPNTRMFFGNRDDYGAPSGWRAYQEDWAFKPAGDSMCISRMPFNMYTNEFLLSASPEIDIAGFISDSDESNVNTVNYLDNETLIIDINLINSDVKAVNTSVILEANSEVVFLDSCNGIVDNNTISWSIGDMNYQESWNCRITLNVQGEVVFSIEASSGNTNSNQVNLNANEILIPEISLVKTVSENEVYLGDEFYFEITLTVPEQTTLTNVMFVDICADCSSLILLNEEGDLLLNSNINIPPGVYSVSRFYRVNSLESAEITNCVYLKVEQSENEFYTTCASVTNLGEKPADGGGEYEEGSSNETEVPIVDTVIKFVPDDVIEVSGLIVSALQNNVLEVIEKPILLAYSAGNGHIFVPLLICLSILILLKLVAYCQAKIEKWKKR